MSAVRQRLATAFSALHRDQRLVVGAAAAVLVSMLLPWYTKTTVATGPKGLQSADSAQIALFVPSFIEASIALVAVAVVALMLARGERRQFDLPFPDRIVVAAAGVWVSLLIFLRFVDTPDGSSSAAITTSFQLSWGIWFALVSAAALIAAGLRLQHPPHQHSPLLEAPDATPEAGTGEREPGLD